jgi:hypothetical protein
MKIKGRKDMTEDFKKWLCEKGNIQLLYWEEYTLTHILVCAMWAINREWKWTVIMSKAWINVLEKDKIPPLKTFYYQNFNNSEQEALREALKYIFEQEER